MQVSFTLFFYLMGIVLTGILLGSASYLRDEYASKNRSAQYWLISLISTILGYFVFSYAISNAPNDIKGHSFLFTIANVLYVGGLVFQVLFCHVLRADSKKALWFACGFLIFFAIEFEWSRGAGLFSFRVVQVAVISLLCLIWQFVNLARYVGTHKSLQLKLLLGCTALEMLLVIARALVGTKLGAVDTIDAIPAPLLILTFTFSACNSVSYLIAAGYWAEQNIAKRVQARIENEKVKGLLLERDTLIGSLLKANKNSTTAAISASMAHELNQPIAAIDVNLFMLEKALEEAPIDVKKAETLLGSIAMDNQRLANIIKSIGAIFKNQPISYQSTEVSELLSSITRIAGPDCRSKGIALRVIGNQNGLITVDITAIQQVLLNLVSNAIAALEKSNTVEKIIEIETSILNADIRFSVADNGPGVPSQYQAKLFELMQSNKEGGSGLGLWLCKHIVTEYGGMIFQENQATGGAKFTFDLPKVAKNSSSIQ